MSIHLLLKLQDQSLPATPHFQLSLLGRVSRVRGLLQALWTLSMDSDINFYFSDFENTFSNYKPGYFSDFENTFSNYKPGKHLINHPQEL